LAQTGYQLQETEEKYKILIENMNEGLCVADRNFVISFVNNRTCEIMGCNKNELLGKKVLSFFEGKDREKLIYELGKRKQGKSSRYTVPVKTKKGNRVVVLISAVPLFDRDGKFNGGFAILSDQTERMRLEEKLRKHAMELEKEIEERTRQLVDLYKGVAVTEERHRLAQEIHDGLAQTLATSLLKIDLCGKLLGRDQEQAIKELSELRSTLATSIRETRHAIFELSLPKLHRTGFATVLKQYFTEFCRKTGVKCSLEFKVEKSLPTRIQIGTYRIIREAMNNVKKHADAKHVDARLWTDKAGDLCLVVGDDGKGFDLKTALAQAKDTKNFGLMGMKEQARLLGGTLTIMAAEGQGTRIRLKVPLE